MFDEPSFNVPGEVGLDQFGASIFTEMNRGVTPIFMTHTVENPKKSEEAGRPIFDEVEVYQLLVAGDAFNRPSGPVDDTIKRRFADQYRAWKEKKIDRSISGTPLRAWTLLSIANIAEFEALNIFSVDALANIPDTALSRSQGLREWRERAKAYMASSIDNAATAKLADENLRLKDDMAQMKGDFDRMAAKVAELESGKKKAA